MSDDSVTLAAAWRARVAAGYPGPISVRLTARGFAVLQLGGDGVCTRLAVEHARYRADARAEQYARNAESPPAAPGEPTPAAGTRTGTTTPGEAHSAT